MEFKDTRSMKAISDSLENLNCKLYDYLESTSIFFANCYSKTELEMAEIFARSITDDIYIRPELRPEFKMMLCIELKTDDFSKTF